MDTPWGAIAPTPVQPPCVACSDPACSDPLRYAEDSVNVDRAERHDIRDDNGGGSTWCPHPSDGYVGSLVVTPWETPR